MVVPVPIVLGMPAMVASAPPSVVALPAAFTLCVKIATAVFRFMARGSVLADSLIYPRLCLFDPMLTIAVIIGI